MALETCVYVPIHVSPAGHEAAEGAGGRGQREGRLAQIAVCHWQFINDEGLFVSGSWVFRDQKC